mmetsp:Transcript_10865/g.23015  ORF Transcript_10865/g.23015 Transcript_10865/m.23015 type:complete len:143 (+) Transcript_10865:139-567(+)
MSSIEKTCAYCGLPPRKDENGICIKMKKCSRCKIVSYHDIDCQKHHWKIHKNSCGKKDSTTSSQSSSGAASATRGPAPSNRTKRKHRSITPTHKLVTNRYKELRSQGVSAQEAMKRAQDEFHPSDEKVLESGSKVAAMFGLR